MSELKIVKQSDVLWGNWFTEYYLKSEADKVIAELKEKLAAAQLALRLNQPEALDEEYYPKAETDKLLLRKNIKYAFSMSLLEHYKSLSDEQLALDNEVLYKVYRKRSDIHYKRANKWAQIYRDLKEAK